MPPDRASSSSQSQGSPSKTSEDHLAKRASFEEKGKVKSKPVIHWAARFTDLWLDDQCDRFIPCGLCVKLGKQCVQPTRRRRTKEYVDELENRLSELQQIHSDQHQQQASTSTTTATFGISRSRRNSSIPPPEMIRGGSVYDRNTLIGRESNERERDRNHDSTSFIISPSSTMNTSSISENLDTSIPLADEGNSNPYDIDPSALPSSSHHQHHQDGFTSIAQQASQSLAGPSYTSPTATNSTSRSHSHMQSSISSAFPKNNNNNNTAPSPYFNMNPHTIPSSSVRPNLNQNPSTSEVLERQPSSARGYEWNERHSHLTDRGNDGYASLSIKPDGQGYLGFASGSTLLRILQICAGSIPLTAIDTESQNQIEYPKPENWKPTTMDIDNCLNAYFELYHPQYPLFHEPTFRAQWNELIPQPKPKEWDLLCNLVLSLGAFCSYKPMYMVDYFMESAISLITADFLESGSLTLVQAYCLLHKISQQRNKPNSSSVYLGIAMRLAIGLGLHRELPFWNITPFEREIRRRLWCAMVAFDAGACITYGRPVLQPSYPAESDVRMVHNVHDKSFTPAATHAPIEVAEPTVYSTIIWASHFHMNTNHIYQKIMSMPAPTSYECLKLDYELDEWSKLIPDYFQPANTNSTKEHWLRFGSYKMLWRFYNLKILLHRRMFLDRALRGLPLWSESQPPSTSTNSSNTNIRRGRGDGDEDINEDDTDEMNCCKRCQNSASETINSIEEFFKIRLGSENRLEAWYGLHFLFQASFIPLIALHTDKFSSRRFKWEEQVNQARSILIQLKKTDPLAERCLKIVNLLSPQPNSNPSSNESNNHPSASAFSSISHLQQNQNPNNSLPLHHNDDTHHHHQQQHQHQDPFSTSTSTEHSNNNWLDDLFQNNPNISNNFSNDFLQGQTLTNDWAQNLMPFADLGTLSSIWPSSNSFGGNNNNNNNNGGFG
ncbi:uncharacterized protein L201_004490 [Kwoniella dendrophila CBS 6074]|uniref:Xylanolytic transcriptional activator regulatory domain-containing protein n=1 Tax=Kwoniella dendrophila CBS 6074 TaxID=1295534 RepID=A0AAX4JVV2_9TREE